MLPIPFALGQGFRSSGRSPLKLSLNVTSASLGSELLEAVQKHFTVNLVPDERGYLKTFGLGPNEYLFNAEGTGLGAALITLFSSPSVRPFTVGELYRAIVEVQRRQL